MCVCVGKKFTLKFNYTLLTHCDNHGCYVITQITVGRDANSRQPDFPKNLVRYPLASSSVILTDCIFDK